MGLAPQHRRVARESRGQTRAPGGSFSAGTAAEPGRGVSTLQRAAAAAPVHEVRPGPCSAGQGRAQPGTGPCGSHGSRLLHFQNSARQFLNLAVVIQ